MNLFKKLKQLLTSNANPPTNPPPTLVNVSNESSKYPKIVSLVMTWFDSQAWKYEYRSPDEGSDVHHLILGFTDNEHDWTCVFRIHEKNELVSILGVLDDVVPASHYTAVLVAFAKVNISVGYGSVELDVTDGEVRAKLAFDGEFTNINERSLGCYMQAVSGLTELARAILQEVLANDNPSQDASDYLEVGDEVVAKVGDDRQSFFVPTKSRQ